MEISTFLVPILVVLNLSLRCIIAFDQNSTFLDTYMKVSNASSGLYLDDGPLLTICLSYCQYVGLDSHSFHLFSRQMVNHSLWDVKWLSKSLYECMYNCTYYEVCCGNESYHFLVYWECFYVFFQIYLNAVWACLMITSTAIDIL